MSTFKFGVAVIVLATALSTATYAELPGKAAPQRAAPQRAAVPQRAAPPRAAAPERAAPQREGAPVAAPRNAADRSGGNETRRANLNANIKSHAVRNT